DLTVEGLRGLVAAALVLVVDAVAEGPAGQVEGHREMGGPLGGDDVDEHAGEAVDGVGGLAAAVAEAVRGQGEEGPEGHRVAVDQKEALVIGVARTHEEQSPMSRSPPRTRRAVAVS